ncbi:MAG: GntR family transcriptional regulator, partial [Armatimonadetes bacterium]|nr:GntR family transcriptional regulator [Candidatus Hippobium faecium]
ITKTKRIEQYLREQIKKGVWKKGDLLPKSKDLAKELKSSEFILREAMLPLIKEGILGRRTRVGTYVLGENSIANGKILLLDITNVQYSGSNFAFPSYLNYEIDLIKKKGLEYKTSIGTNNIPLKELVSQLQLENTYFMKGVTGIINNISFLPNSFLEKTGIPAISFSSFPTDRENEIIYDINSLYFFALSLLSQFSHNIAVFRNDYSKISEMEGDYSLKRDYLLNSTINKFKDSITLDIEIDFYSQTYINIYNTFIETVSKNPKTDAVFIGDPTFIPAIHHAIEDMKIKTPEDMKIICYSMPDINYGFDLTWARLEMEYSTNPEPVLDILLKKIKGENVQSKIHVYPNFIKGNSLF